MVLVVVIIRTVVRLVPSLEFGSTPLPLLDNKADPGKRLFIRLGVLEFGEALGERRVEIADEELELYSKLFKPVLGPSDRGLFSYAGGREVEGVIVVVVDMLIMLRLGDATGVVVEVTWLFLLLLVVLEEVEVVIPLLSVVRLVLLKDERASLAARDDPKASVRKVRALSLIE